MVSILPGLTVARTIPGDVLLGLLSGDYALHGGVIRWAAGTAQAGQIVRHLLPVVTPALGMLPLSALPGAGQIVHAFQLARIQGLAGANLAITQRVLQVATGTMALSGLNLALSAVSFAVLSHRLSQLDGRLAEVQRDVKAIRELLERKSRAQLRAALAGLEKVDLTTDIVNRRDLLARTHHDLEPLLQEYGELLQVADDVERAMVAEEYYLLIALAQVRCSAELGEFARAEQELRAALTHWRAQARRVAQKLLLGKDPERLLYQETVAQFPTAALIACLDFANDTAHGLGWVDTLRGKMPHYHRNEGAGVGVSWFNDRKGERRREREVIVPALIKLTARGQLVDGYEAQLETMVRHQLTPSELARRVAGAAAEAVDGYLILAPAELQENDRPPSLINRLFGSRDNRSG